MWTMFPCHINSLCKNKKGSAALAEPSAHQRYHLYMKSHTTMLHAAVWMNQPPLFVWGNQAMA